MTKITVTPGSLNVFADIGWPDAEVHFLKAQIVFELFTIVKGRKLTQAKAGAMMGISQPEVSRMFRGQFSEYSVERLMGFLTAFGRDVDIIVRPTTGRKRSKGAITFVPEAA